jgi:preprotein translocase subunit SecA
VDAAVEGMKKQYGSKAEIIGESNLRTLERMVSLRVIDTKWREHLLTMDELRDGIWTVGYGERNPLVEYKLRGFKIFGELQEAIKEDIVEILMKVQVQQEQSFDEAPAQYRRMGREQHAEVGQFGTGGVPQQNDGTPFVNPDRKKKDAAPVEGGVKRKKTRRDRR